MMRKTLTIVAFVTLALVLLTSPVLAVGSGRSTVLAQTQTWPKYHIISFTGTAASWTTSTLTVNVQLTNKPYLLKRGSQVTVGTTSRTVYYIWDGKTRTRKYSLSQLGLTVGTKVSINATVYSTGAITANRIEVYKPRYAP